MDKKGVRRTFWMPEELDVKVEKFRKNLGLGRSAFYRFAVVELLKETIQPKVSDEFSKNRLIKKGD